MITKPPINICSIRIIRFFRKTLVTKCDKFNIRFQQSPNMALTFSILLFLVLKLVNSTDQEFDLVDCHSELVDEETLQYRVWCDSQTRHGCCWIQEMCWTQYNTPYGSDYYKGISLDLFEVANLTQFDFAENASEVNSFESCEILITVLGK